MSDPAEYKDLLRDIEAFMTRQEPSAQTMNDVLEFPAELLASLAALVAQHPIDEQHAREAHAKSESSVILNPEHPGMSPFVVNEPPGFFQVSQDVLCSDKLSFESKSVITPPTQSCSIVASPSGNKQCPQLAELGYCPDLATCHWSHDHMGSDCYDRNSSYERSRAMSTPTGFPFEYGNNSGLSMLAPSSLLVNNEETLFGSDDQEVPALSLGHLDPRTIRLYKTRFCSFGPECPYRVKGRCIYAHSKDEMRSRPPPPTGYPRLPSGASTPQMSPAIGSPFVPTPPSMASAISGAYGSSEFGANSTSNQQQQQQRATFVNTRVSRVNSMRSRMDSGSTTVFEDQLRKDSSPSSNGALSPCSTAASFLPPPGMNSTLNPGAPSFCPSWRC